MTVATSKIEIAPQLAQTAPSALSKGGASKLALLSEDDTSAQDDTAISPAVFLSDVGLAEWADNETGFGVPLAAANRALVSGDFPPRAAAAGEPIADDAGVAAKTARETTNVAASGAETGDSVASAASDTNSASVIADNSPIVIADGAAAEIDGPSAQSVTFTGASGVLKLADAPAFSGKIQGLQGSDAIDFADIGFGAGTTATFLGDAAGGTLTVTDGTTTAKLALVGDYLSSSWTVSGDGAGGVTVVDPTVSTNWQTLKIGGGGFVRGLDIAANGVTVARTDTNGAYLWNGSSWVQLVTASSMPAGYDFSAMASGNQGVEEIQIAPSNTNIFYMEYDGAIFKSVNQGTTWTFETSLVASTTDNPNDSYGQDGQKMAIDPNNPNIVYAGTETAGLFVTTDGGATWAKVSAVPVGSNSGITGILFDPGVGGTVGGVTQTIFASSNGNGVYESTNGGATWTHLAGGPADVQYAAVSSTGVYYAIGSDSTGKDNNALWSYANGVWTNLWDAQGTASQQALQGIAVDPSNPNELALVNAGGYLYVSYNAGATWTQQFHTDAVSTDIPWEASANTNPNGGYPYAFLDVGGVAFNPLVPNQLVVSGGTGVWTTTVPASTAVQGSDLNFYDESVGIENLVAQKILVAPGGNPLLVSWDRPFLSISYAELDSGAYPTTYGPVSSDNIVKGSSADYASSTPSFLVGIADNWGTEQSGYSTDGGQTWTPFASEIPGAGSTFIGGTIAASTTQNFVWAPAGGHQPYYTLNGGQSWTAVTLPGVTSWSTFDWSPYLDQQSVTADRVLANTFYLYYPGQGVFETTNGGQSWTDVHPGNIGPAYYEGYNSELESVPNEAGHLFYTGGVQGAPSSTPAAEPFYQSTDGGATWTAVANVQDVISFGFGAAAPGQSVPAVYIVGYVNNVYGIWQSINNGGSWTQIGTFPVGQLDLVRTISGDPNAFGQVYVGFSGGSYVYLAATPEITAVTESPASGLVTAGAKVTFTLTANENLIVAGGAPTLTLNDGGVATYTGGSGTNVLTFAYTVAAGQSTASLAAAAINLPTGVTVKDGAGNAASLSLTGISQAGPQIGGGAVAPAFTAVSESPASGDLAAGATVTLTLTANEALTVAGGAPTLTLNDGGVATYTGGSGTNALTFAYTVAAGQSTASLAAAAINLPTGVTVKDAAGNAASLSLTGLSQTGPQIDTAAPVFTAVTESPASGDLTIGATVTFTLTANEALTVAGGAPTLTLNDGGMATYTGGSGTNALTFAYTVGATQDTASLAATAINLPTGVTVKDAAGNAASLSLAGLVQDAPQIDTVTPAFTSVSESPASGDLTAGATVTLKLTATEALTVAGGAPTLTLNDGGVATYTGGSGTNVLTFAYTVAAGQSTASLAAAAINLPTGVTVKDGAGNAASLSLAGLSQTGPQIGSAVSPAFTAVSESPASGDLTAGATVTLKLTANEALTVAGGAPTLTLNDGGVATYTGGSGTNVLTFAYTVAAGQNTASLAAATINLPTGVTVKDAAGNAASLSLAGLGQTGPQIDTVAPAFTAVTESPASGDLTAGATVTLTLTANEALTVAGGAPTLTLNDGGVATYTGGSGTKALTFAYTVAAGQSTASLAAAAINLPTGVTVKDGAGNAASLSLAGLSQTGPQIGGALSPTFTAVTETPASGDFYSDITITITLTANEALTVAGGAPTLTLNDGGVATYSGGSGTNVLTFNYVTLAGQNTPSLAAAAINLPTGVTIKDASGNAASLSLTGLTQTGPQIDTVVPAFTAVTESPASGDLAAGATVTITLQGSKDLVVSGGAPTLTLNDGGVATYTGGSGTTALTFAYTVAAGQSTASLAATAVNLPTGVTITDNEGHTASLSLTGLSQAGPQINTVTPAFTAITESPASGDLTIGATVTLKLTANENLFVAGGAPTLTLNDGGVATYTGGSGTNVLTFAYTVGASQDTASLAATAINLPTGVTIKDGAGNAASLSLAGLVQDAPQIDTLTPAFTAVSESPASGDLAAGATVTLKLTANENLTVAGGKPTLKLNDGGVATYTGGSGTNVLTFAYTVAAGQNTASLAAAAFNLPTGVTVKDGAGNAASLSLTGLSQTGPQIDTVTPAFTAVTESPASGNLTAGATVTLKLTANENLTVAGGKPTLTLNDGGVATYTGGSGTNVLTFAYTVAAGQSTTSLAAAAINLPTGVTVKDGAGNAASLSLAGLSQTGPRIGSAVTPAFTAVTESPATGDFYSDITITIKLTANEALTVAGGKPTLTLNDGGVATYSGGSGTNVLTFNYVTLAGQNTPSLKATAVNLPTGVTIKDAAGNAASLSLSGLRQTGPQIDTVVPAFTAVTENPASGDLAAGATVTITLQGSKDLVVSGGAPTLTLNDGGVATYTGGSGTTALTFAYTVAAGQSTASLAATAVNLPTGAKITDNEGHTASLSLTGLSQTGPQIDAVASAAPKSSAAEPDITVTLYDGATRLETYTTTASTLTIAPDTSEIIYAAGVTNETFDLNAKIGSVTINGFQATGTTHDVLEFHASSFGANLSASNQSADLAALLHDTTQNSAGSSIIKDANSGDILTLVGISKSTLSAAANAGDFKFV